jgi:hypothetical protein
MTINSRSVTSSVPKEIDPNFFLPPGVAGVKYANPEDKDTNLVDDDEGEVVPVSYDDVTPVTVDTSSIVTLFPPGTIYIVNQIVRVAVGGGYAVDVIIDVVDSVPNVVGYDIRLTKT